MKTPCQLVQQALSQLLRPEALDADTAAQFFSPQYQQHVDGRTLNYVEFLAHLDYLKSQVQQMHLQILAIASNGNTVMTHHRVDVTRHQGTTARLEVLARFECIEGRIISCYEHSRLCDGDTQDRYLGSAMSES